MIKQISDITLFTKQPGIMVDFYTNKLGMKVKFTLNNKSGVPFQWHLEAGNLTFLAIRDNREPNENGPEKGTCVNTQGLQHVLSLETENLAGTRAFLKKKNVSVGPVITGPDLSKRTTLHDPDGNTIHLAEYTVDSLQIQLALTAQASETESVATDVSQ
jgi:catechol 2,3-dioxygenase-like lactoylglutathione lyase family enzyme